MNPPEPIRELVVLSHLRWDWVWQRPQHLISRVGADVPTWFVEEPLAADGTDRATLRIADGGSVQRVWTEVPGPSRWVPFGSDDARAHHASVVRHLPPRPGRVVWLYTALALELARSLRPDVLVYDVMDDLAAFRGAAPEQRLRHHAALRDADVVFTGGRSLQRTTAAVRPRGTYCFPSGVETEHYAPARALRPEHRSQPVAGYVGVVDERLDLELVAGLAAALPEWRIEMVGPVAKLDPAQLPQAPNLHWRGPAAYADLPDVMAGFDVALMPFALNEATRSISPTKTLEYFAAGLPVVSTRVPDVVADYGDIVDLVDDPVAAATACRNARAFTDPAVVARREEVLQRQHWDQIALTMRKVVSARFPERQVVAPA